MISDASLLLRVSPSASRLLPCNSSPICETVAMSVIAQPTFNADEQVLCFHGPLIYEAKVRRDPRPS